MANNVAAKGFAYRLGHGLGAVVACLRAGEQRMLASAGRVGTPVMFLLKLLFLALKLGVVASLFVALLPALSWLAAMAFALLVGGVFLYSLANTNSSTGYLADEDRLHGHDVYGRKLDSWGNVESEWPDQDQ